MVGIQSLTILDQSKKKSSLESICSILDIHWKLRSCEGAIALKEIYEDLQFVYLVFDLPEDAVTLGRFTDKNCLTEA